MRLASVLPIVLSVLLGSGCATIFSGRNQRIRVASAPLRARVIVEYEKSDGGQISSYETPAEIILPRRKSNVRLRIEKDGFEPVAVDLRRKSNGMLALNLANPVLAPVAIADGSTKARVVAFAAFVLAWIGIDVVTGAAYRLDPSDIAVTLAPVSEAAGSSEGPSPQGRQ